MTVCKSDYKMWLCVLSWFAVAASALFAVAVYGTTEGKQEEAPAYWPEGLQAMIHPDPARSTLVLFAHPLCPCTRASLYELESVANRLFGMVDLHILFFSPSDTSAMSDQWQASDLKKLASRLPGTQMHADVDGQIARHFGAYTSGQVLLYDTAGKLQFAGGVTPSRGHAGTNPGRALVISSILGDDGVDPLAPRVNPVYGCSLHSDEPGDRKLISNVTPVFDSRLVL